MDNPDQSTLLIGDTLFKKICIDKKINVYTIKHKCKCLAFALNIL